MLIIFGSSPKIRAQVLRTIGKEGAHTSHRATQRDEGNKRDDVEEREERNKGEDRDDRDESEVTDETTKRRMYPAHFPASAGLF